MSDGYVTGSSLPSRCTKALTRSSSSSTGGYGRRGTRGHSMEFQQTWGSGVYDFGRGEGMVFSRVQAPAVFAYPAVVPVVILSFVS